MAEPADAALLKSAGPSDRGGSNPSPGTDIIHTRLCLLGVGEGQFQLDTFLIMEPGNGADGSGENLPLVLRVAGRQDLADVPRVLAEAADAHEGVGRLLH